MNSSSPLGFQGRLIVHLGPHKTGSTTIQMFLKTNYSALRSEGILYPVAGRMRQGRVLHFHHPLILSMLGEKDGSPTSHIEAMRAEIEEAQPHTVILSSEVLSREYLSSEAFGNLKLLFPHAKREWILYLRRQDSLLVSRYAEMIKVGLIGWPSSISAVNSPYYLDHRLRLEKLCHAVGTDRILAVSFEATRHALVSEFFSKCRLCLPMTEQKEGHHNPAYPWGVLNVLRLANSLPGWAKQIVRRGAVSIGLRLARTRARQLVSWGIPLSDRQAAEIRSQYFASNRYVEEVFLDGARFLTDSDAERRPRAGNEKI